MISKILFMRSTEIIVPEQQSSMKEWNLNYLQRTKNIYSTQNLTFALITKKRTIYKKKKTFQCPYKLGYIFDHLQTFPYTAEYFYHNVFTINKHFHTQQNIFSTMFLPCTNIFIHSRIFLPCTNIFIHSRIFLPCTNIFIHSRIFLPCTNIFIHSRIFLAQCFYHVQTFSYTAE